MSCASSFGRRHLPSSSPIGMPVAFDAVAVRSAWRDRLATHGQSTPRAYIDSRFDFKKPGKINTFKHYFKIGGLPLVWRVLTYQRAYGDNPHPDDVPVRTVGALDYGYPQDFRCRSIHNVEECLAWCRGLPCLRRTCPDWGRRAGAAMARRTARAILRLPIAKRTRALRWSIRRTAACRAPVMRYRCVHRAYCCFFGFR